MADIFISYASVDQARVEPLVGHLESAGYSVWWDRQLAGGAVYARKIESEILNASVVLVVWSHDSLASQWVADEAEIGRQNNKLLPIRIDPIDAPIGFRQIQTLDFANWQGQAGGHEFEALISSCDQLIGDKPDTSPGETKPTTALSSVAVLPFLNMSSDPEQEFFSDGISEELLNLLCKIPKLKVTARTSSFAFKKTDKSIGEIGKLLGVGHILEGSVRKAGNRVRITAQLIETESGFHLWSETFDRTLDDIFAIQDEISAAIVEELKKHILGDVVAPVATRAISTDAYQKFLIGQQAFGQRTQKSLEEAKAAFEACLKIDPDFVPALINLADAHMLLGDGAICYGRMPMNQALALALPLLDKAEGLSRNSEEIHTSRAFYYCLQGDYDQAQTHAEKAISINANCSKAYRTLGFILKRGANPRAMVTRAREKALHLDPASPIDLINLFEDLTVRSRFAESNALVDRIYAVDPNSIFFDWGRFSVAWDRGRLKDALEVYLTSEKLKQDRQWAFSIQQVLTLFGHGPKVEHLDPASALGIYCAYGYRDDANRIGAKLNEAGSPPLNALKPTTLALWHVQEGRLEEADKVLRPLEETDPLKWGAFYDLDNYCLGARLSWLISDRLGDTQRADHLSSKLQELYAARIADHEGVHIAVHFVGACIAAMHGDIKSSLAELKTQVERFSIASYDIFFDPLLIQLNDQPGFQDLKKKVEDDIDAEKHAATTSGLLAMATEED